MRGWDEFSEFLLENRVPTSADFNTYPIRIFVLGLFIRFCLSRISILSIFRAIITFEFLIC